MKSALVFGAICVMMALTGCERERISGTGPLVSEERNVANFTGVKLTGSLNVTVTHGLAFQVVVRDHANLLPYFETVVRNGVLELGFRPNTSIRNTDAEIYITMPSIDYAGLEGSGNIEIMGIFSTPNFASSIVGSGNIYAFDVHAQNATTTIEGSGNTEITASGTLSATITGSGNIYYKGNALVNANITGSGRVIKK